MMDSLIKVLRIVAALVSIACFALFFSMIGHRQGYLKGYFDGRSSIQSRIDTLINYQKEVESLFRQIDVKCDSIDKLMKEEKK